MEDKQLSALNSQWLLSIFLFLSPPTGKKTERRFASHGKKKVQQKNLTNKRSIKYHNICFHLHISKHALFSSSRKKLHQQHKRTVFMAVAWAIQPMVFSVGKKKINSALKYRVHLFLHTFWHSSIYKYMLLTFLNPFTLCMVISQWDHSNASFISVSSLYPSSPLMIMPIYYASNALFSSSVLSFLMFPKATRERHCL